MYRDPSDWSAMAGYHRTPRAPTQDALRVEIPLDLVQRLMEEGLIGASDLRCLDHGSKQRLQQLCLDNCARDLGSRGLPLGAGMN